ncbi:MAG: ammonium transporter, partial [Acidobacteriota bacterium]|nr:ammonium transporter [Acidobacteriota bacterium]
MMKKLSFYQRLSRLQVRLHDPEWRRYGTLLLAGKMVGVGLLLLGIVALFPDLMGFGKVLAADTEV